MIDILFKYIKLAEEILYILVNVVCICIMAKTLYESVMLLVKDKGSEARKALVKGINITLSFNLACEVLDIIVSREIKEVTFVGGILLLKLLIAFLLHCEDKWEYEEENHKSIKKKNV
ncbi:MAG: DUF1622 domain-containing protein [Lachnospiraceae bacterium]|nr:DUF1622 domain-containing protein [Lachnospiraceae bacterium]